MSKPLTFSQFFILQDLYNLRGLENIDSYSGHLQNSIMELIKMKFLILNGKLVGVSYKGKSFMEWITRNKDFDSINYENKHRRVLKIMRIKNKPVDTYWVKQHINNSAAIIDLLKVGDVAFIEDDKIVLTNRGIEMAEHFLQEEEVTH